MTLLTALHLEMTSTVIVLTLMTGCSFYADVSRMFCVTYRCRPHVSLFFWHLRCFMVEMILGLQLQ